MSDKKKSDLDSIVEHIEKKKDEQMRMVSFNDVFSTSFLTTFTQFTTFKELLDAGNFNVNSPEDFQAIQNKKFDEFINKTTKFKNWEEMQKTAINEFMKKMN